MNRTIKSVLALTVLVSTAISNAVPHVFFRPQEVNAPREMVGQQLFMNLCDMDKTNGVFSIVPEFTQSFRDGRIADCLIGNCGTSSCNTSCNNSCSDSCNDGATVVISGSQVTGRGANDWMADYFGLPTDFKSTLTLKPRIRNFLVDLQFYLGLDELASGLYFKIHAPIVNTRWNLRASENVIAAGTNNYAAGYFNATGVARANLNAQALSYFTGSVPNLNDLTSAGYVSPACIGNVTFDALQYGKIGCKDATKTRLADIEMALGWNFWCDEDYLIGASIRFSAPTGNLPENEWLFNPVVGSEKHWKLGAGLNAQAIFWRSEDEDRSFGVFLDARVQHLFNHCQKRTFDLCGKPNSRYMLAQKLGAQTVSTSPRPELAQSVDTLLVEWQNEFSPVANLTASNVDIKIAVEGDVALKFSYFSHNWEYDLGYNFYGRSCEKICRKSGCGVDPLATNQWTLKGDAQVVGFTNGVTYAYQGQNCVRLATSQSCATINAGVNVSAAAATGATQVAIQNPGVDQKVLAVTSTATGGGSVYAVTSGTSLPINTSLTPVFITDADVDLSGTQTLTNKLFANVSYSWRDNEDWTPFLGIGGEVEFAQGNNCASNNSCATTGACNPATATTTTTTSTGCSSSCASSCGSCARCGLSQWGVWLKGGIAFN